MIVMCCFRLAAVCRKFDNRILVLVVICVSVVVVVGMVAVVVVLVASDAADRDADVGVANDVAVRAGVVNAGGVSVVGVGW